MLQAKKNFQERFESLQIKVVNNRERRIKKLSIVIMKAYAEKQRQEEHNMKVAAFVHSKLETMKLRRILKAMRSFTAWKRHWVQNVAANFEK